MRVVAVLAVVALLCGVVAAESFGVSTPSCRRHGGRCVAADECSAPKEVHHGADCGDNDDVCCGPAHGSSASATATKLKGRRHHHNPSPARVVDVAAPAVLKATGPTSPACAAKQGSCIASSACTGIIVKGLCPGTSTCCTPKAAATPATPATPAPATPAPAASSASSVTAAQLISCMPGLSSSKAATVLPFLNAAQAEAQINTCKRKTAWLAQLGHESGSLVYMEEIASGSAYNGRRDLGNVQPGDGPRFKGRGPIQLTGRTNYNAAGKALGLDLISNPTSVATNAVGFRTSAWFWSSHGLNALADSGSFSTITLRINGGTNGAADRNARYAKCRKALGC